jgi:hypothetical protein
MVPSRKSTRAAPKARLLLLAGRAIIGFALDLAAPGVLSFWFCLRFDRYNVGSRTTVMVSRGRLIAARVREKPHFGRPVFTKKTWSLHLDFGDDWDFRGSGSFRTIWEFADLYYGTDTDTLQNLSYLYIPVWTGVTALACLLTLGYLIVRILRSAPLRVGRCSVCGYDMRATPSRCPECGAVSPVDNV